MNFIFTEMSTVDAAIINYITNGGGSGGGGSGGGGTGVVYTAGDGISLANNKIAVRYNANTMEIVNGVLSAKVSSSGGGGGSGEGSTTEIMTHLTNVSGRYSQGNYIEYTKVPKDIIRTGLRLRLYYTSTEADRDYVLIVHDYTFPQSSTSDNPNATFIPLSTEYESLSARIYTDDGGVNYIIRITESTVSGANISYWSEDGKYGLFQVQQHTPQTLTIIQQADIQYRLLPHLNLIKYFEETIETLKKKVGI